MEMEHRLNETDQFESIQQISVFSNSSRKANSLNSSTFIKPGPNEMKIEQHLIDTDLIFSSQQNSLHSSSPLEADSLNYSTFIKPDINKIEMEQCLNDSTFMKTNPDEMRYNVNKTSQGLSNQQISMSSPLKCEVKEEMIYCHFCSYSDVDFDRLKFHTFTQHPTEAAVVKFGESDQDIKFFCVKETCNFSTTMCTVYEEHLMNCCVLHHTLSGKEKKRLKSTLQFVLDFHSKHCLSDVTGILEYFSSFNKINTYEDDHVQLRKHTGMEHNDLFSVVSRSSSLSDVHTSMVCEDVGGRDLEGSFSSVSIPVPVFIVQNQNTDLFDSQRNSSENNTISVRKQLKNNEQLLKTGLSEMKINKSQVHTGTQRETQNEKKPFRCAECDKSFKYHSELLKHMRVYVKGKIFKCEVCDKAFRQSQHLISHKLIHTGEKPFICDVCNKEFTRSNDLIVHKRIHTGEKPFKCNVCDKVFANSGTLSNHKRIHTGEKPFKCNVCNKAFTQSQHLNIHKAIHTGEKPFKCLECNKRFSISSNFHRHTKIHTGEKPFKCNVCNKEFTRSNNLNAHKRTHIDGKPFKCSVCDKGFTDSSNFNKHQRTHTGEKPYKCNVCNKEFSRSNNLNVHKRTHTGEKPYI